MPKFKTKRRIMRSFKMGEISGVDKPAQAGATIVLAKCADQTDEVLDLSKGLFNSILQEKEVEEKAQSAFWEAFEDQWRANDAFKAALCDAYADSEETLREYLEKFESMARDAAVRIKEIRGGDNLGKSLYFYAVADAANGFTDQEDHPMYKTKAELEAAIAKFFADGGDANLIKQLRKAAVEFDAIDLLKGDLAMGEPVRHDDGEVAALKRDISILKMDDQTRTHFDSLSEGDQGAFLAKSADDQRADVDAANAADPILYKSADGAIYRKSGGEGVAALAKRLDDAEGRIAKAEGERDAARFEKMAETEFAFLPREGTVQMLKAAEKLSDDEKKKMLDAMRASNGQAKKTHKAIGSTAGVTGEEGDGASASDQLDELAKRYANEKSVPLHKAYDAVLETSEGSALYSEMVGHQPAVTDAE